MAQGNDVLRMLRPDGGWVISGDEYEGIQFIDCEPITKAQFEAGFAAYDAWKAEQEEIKVAGRQALLAQLGITEEQAKLLLN